MSEPVTHTNAEGVGMRTSEAPFAAADGYAADYRELVDGELYKVGDECLHNGKWTQIGDLFAGYRYVKGLCLQARRRHTAERSNPAQKI